MRFPVLISALCALVAAALLVTACGGDDTPTATDPSDGERTSVTVYSSLPLQGDDRDRAVAISRGIDLALAQAGNRAGRITVEHTRLDSSTAEEGGWTAEQTARNAQRVARDDSAVAYIGELHDAASAISMPLLNEAGVAQVSPMNTAIGLTTEGPGVERDEPDMYYPTGTRHYVRIMQNDRIQGLALASTMTEDACATVGIVTAEERYGTGLAQTIEGALEEQEIELGLNERVEVTGEEDPDLAGVTARAQAAGVDCMLFVGSGLGGAVAFFDAMATALPDARLYGTQTLAKAEFADPDDGGIPEEIAPRVKLSAAVLGRDSYPPEGQEVYERYDREYAGGETDPYAIYGYEAMRLVLDAIERAESTTREDVIKALFDTSERDSVLGQYSIDENGDTTLTTYGMYTIEDGELLFDKVVQVSP